MPGPGRKDVALTHGQHLAENAHLLGRAQRHRFKQRPAPGFKGVYRHPDAALGADGHHEFRHLVAGKIVDADDYIPGRSGKLLLSYKNTIGPNGSPKSSALGLKIQGAGLAVEVAFKAKDKGSGGVV